jgi:hypothetical protein
MGGLMVKASCGCVPSGVAGIRGIIVTTFCSSVAICAAIVALSLDSSAIAATLDSVQGTVQVNSGAGFHKVAGAAQVAPGASIMADPGSSAQILYSDGCRIPVRPGSVAVVAPISPCAQGQAGPGEGPPTDNTTYSLLAAGAVIGGSVGAGVWSSQRGNNNPGFAAGRANAQEITELENLEKLLFQELLGGASP